MMEDTDNNYDISHIEKPVKKEATREERLERLIESIRDKRERWTRLYVGECRGIKLQPYQPNTDDILDDSCNLREQMFDMSNETPEEIAKREQIAKDLDEIFSKYSKKKYKR